MTSPHAERLFFTKGNFMAKNLKNKYPADKTGTKYSEFRNTKRIAPGKTRTEQAKQQASTVAAGNTEQAANKTA
jgi:hypothetical protein